jgi:capsid protein
MMSVNAMLGMPSYQKRDPKPSASSSNRPIAMDMAAESAPRIHARYDAAQTTDEFRNYWAAADSLDADSANSRGVRLRLMQRSRYEAGSNGYFDGMLKIHANYMVGVGPQLRMQTGSDAFNRMVEMAWFTWSKRVQLRRKLHTMARAKMQDGESFAILKSNPRLRNPVKLDLALVEAEQVTSPLLPFGMVGYIDGVRFDEFGNPMWYDVLKYHPGSSFFDAEKIAERVPAEYMLHWFAQERPGQHRGVAEMKSTLNTGAASRRWREATLAAAETAAEIAALLKTNMPPDELADVAAPFSSVDFVRRMMTTLPMGWDAVQMKAEHPNATYESFHRAQVSESGRPKCMPHNLAAGDSSAHNFASGKLDFTPYFIELDVEREDGNDLVLEPLFERWFDEASLRYGWTQIPDQYPLHEFDWPAHPVADEQAKASANETRLQTGAVTLTKLFTENGEDFDDVLVEMAEDYGVGIDEMRAILRNSIFNNKGALASMAQAANQEQTAGGQNAE